MGHGRKGGTSVGGVDTSTFSTSDSHSSSYMMPSQGYHSAREPHRQGGLRILERGQIERGAKDVEGRQGEGLGHTGE